MDPAAIIADLASAHFSLCEVAARHGLTIEALSAYLTSDEAQQKLDQLQSAAAISTRFAAQLHLPIAVAALGTLLASHRAVACPSPTAQQISSPFNYARQDSPPGAHERHADGSHLSSSPNQPNPPSAVPPTPCAQTAVPLTPRDQARAQSRTLRHQVELRRAAATLLRCANFNHRAIVRSRTAEPRHVNTVSETPRTSRPPEPSRTFFPPKPAPRVSPPPDTPPTVEPRDINIASGPPRTSIPPHPAPLTRAHSVDADPSPAATTPTPCPDIPPTPAHRSARARTTSSALSSTPSPATPSIPFPTPSASHLDPSYHSSSSSPLFLRASAPQWLVPSSSPSPTSHRRTSAANRLTAAAGASTHPP